MLRKEALAPGASGAGREHREVCTPDTTLTLFQLEKTSFQKIFNILLVFFFQIWPHHVA